LLIDTSIPASPEQRPTRFWKSTPESVHHPATTTTPLRVLKERLSLDAGPESPAIAKSRTAAP